jgi:hypothetical protein
MLEASPVPVVTRSEKLSFVMGEASALATSSWRIWVMPRFCP